MKRIVSGEDWKWELGIGKFCYVLRPRKKWSRISELNIMKASRNFKWFLWAVNECLNVRSDADAKHHVGETETGLLQYETVGERIDFYHTVILLF